MKAIGSSTTPLPMTPLQLRPQHAARNQLQHELLARDDDRVSGIVAAGIARHHVEPSDRTSTILPLPSSPHWAPRMTADLR